MLSGGRELILDAAHGDPGRGTIVLSHGLSGTPPVLVFAAMRDKDIGGMLPRVACQLIDCHASRQLALGRSRCAGHGGNTRPPGSLSM
jgi:hypothetical protein